MKKYFVLLFWLFLLKNGLSQNFQYPRYYINGKDTLGIIFSLKQSSEILNDKKKLSLYKGLRTGTDSLLKNLWSLKAKYEQNEIMYTSLIELYKKNELEHKSMLQNRESKIDNVTNDLRKCEQQYTLKNEQYMNDEKIIQELKSKQNWLLGGTIGFGVVSLIFTGFLLAN